LDVTQRLVIEAHTQVFTFNGFKVQQNGQEWVLTGLPMSKGTTFGLNDFFDLLGKVADNMDS
jgi:DNA mismatch repair ATPase MutL